YLMSRGLWLFVLYEQSTLPFGSRRRSSDIYRTILETHIHMLNIQKLFLFLPFVEDILLFCITHYYIVLYRIMKVLIIDKNRAKTDDISSSPVILFIFRYWRFFFRLDFKFVIFKVYKYSFPCDFFTA